MNHRRPAICFFEGVHKSFCDLVCPQFIGSHLGDLKEEEWGEKVKVMVVNGKES